MALITLRDGEHLECLLEFDNGKTYEATTYNTTDKVIKVGRITHTNGKMSGNPLGIMTSNKANIQIVDKSGVLVITNEASEFYGYMRNGVKATLKIRRKDNTLRNFGTYYTDGWDTARKNGGYDTTNLNMKNKLEYIGNMELPELGAFSSVNIKELLVAIFEGLGITSDGYYIDPSLNLELTFSVTKGAKVRDTLNNIANALIARITIDNDDVINVRPAFPEIPTVLDELDGEYILSTVIKHNPNNQYNKVRLDFIAVGIRESEVLATMNDVDVIPGKNVINSIEITPTTQGIDYVDLDYGVTGVNYEELIDDIKYTGYQGGVTVEFTSNSEETFKSDLRVWGRTAGITKQSVYADVNTDIKVSNILILTSDYIQNKSAAEYYVNSVADYLEITSAIATMHALLSPDVEAGKYYKVINVADSIAGIYYVGDITYNFGEQYYIDMENIKMKI